eukprot:3120505-Rhodomonas_salina.1
MLRLVRLHFWQHWCYFGGGANVRLVTCRAKVQGGGREAARGEDRGGRGDRQQRGGPRLYLCAPKRTCIPIRHSACAPKRTCIPRRLPAPQSVPAYQGDHQCQARD